MHGPVTCSHLPRSKDSLLGVSDETLFAEQVCVRTLCQLLEWKLPVAAAALDQLAVLRAVRDMCETPRVGVEGQLWATVPQP